MLYTLAHYVWKFTRWITGLIILFLITYAANIGVLRAKDIASTSLVSFINWLFLPGINRTLTLSVLIPLFIITLLSGIIVAIGIHAEESRKAPLKVTEHRESQLESKNRQRLLTKVRAFWITAVFEQSLHGAALLELGLHEQPDAVENPWRLVLREMNQTTHPLPSGTRIKQVYDNAGGELLILGEPGSGKTTLLLELTRNLLDDAQTNDTHPMPVVFNLSSWAVKRQALTDWLVEELNTKYQMPRKLGQLWVDSDQLLLLLDGLDEVSSEFRTECVNAINIYRRNHGLVPTVICSRSTEYLTINHTTRLLLSSAVTIEPLTVQQVDDYLSSAGGQLAPVRMILNHDPVLRELATTPLMLSVLTLAYHGKSVEDILNTGSPQLRRQEVFEKYIERMLQRRSGATRYTIQQTISWLTWLARQMQCHSQTEFYIELMQPDWLPHQLSRLYIYTTGLLLIGLTFGMPMGILFGGLRRPCR